METQDLFQQSEDVYFMHRGRLDSGRITREQFESAVRGIMVEDTQGRFWGLSQASGTWHLYERGNWVQSDPYAAGVAGRRMVGATPTPQIASGTAQSAPVVAAAVKPPSPAPVKPAPAVASKPAVYVFCRSEWNTNMKRFYNPPVDGRGATYAEWQPSYLNYLQKNYGPVTNHACAKYPTREAAQKDFDEAVANARAQPTMNGLPSPIIITKWVY